MGVAAAALDGQSKWSVEYSGIIRDIFRGGDRDDSPGVEDGWNTLLTIYLRFGMWEEVVKDEYWRVPNEFGLKEGNYGDFLGAYCRGHAYWQLGEADKAEEMLAEMMDMTLDDKFVARGKVASLSLRARLAGGEEGLGLLQEAADEQNSWEYNSPPHFIQPVNQCVGAYLLGLGRMEEAKEGERGLQERLGKEQQSDSNATILTRVFDSFSHRSFREGPRGVPKERLVAFRTLRGDGGARLHGQGKEGMGEGRR